MPSARFIDVVVRTAQGPQPEPSGREIEEALTRVLEGETYQRELPRRVTNESPDQSWLRGWRPVATTFLAVGLVITLALLLTWWFHARQSDRLQRERARGRGGSGGVQAGQPSYLAPAHAAADAGRFGEAIHLVLLEALRELDRTESAPTDRPRLAESLTSREILRSKNILERHREALEKIVERVERFLFAGREVDASDWRICLESLERISGPPHGTAER